MRPKVDVEVVVVCRCGIVVLCVRWSGVCGPGQSFDNGVVRVDHPAAALLVEDGAVVVVEEGHGVLLLYFVAAPQARSVMMMEWEFLWSCHVLWMMRANSL